MDNPCEFTDCHLNNGDGVCRGKLQPKDCGSIIVTDIAPVREGIKSIIVEQLGVDPVTILDSSCVIRDLGADSLDEVELLMKIEDNYNIEFDNKEMGENFVVKDIVALTVEKIRSKTDSGV